MDIRLAGFGGQGIVMAGYILGHAGVLDGSNALQTQSYGSESRGGACKSDVIISKDAILELAPSALDVLVAMSQPALDKYLANLRKDGVLVFESDLVTLDQERAGCNNGPIQAFGYPATAVARKTFGRDVVANVLMLGYMAGLTGVATRDSFCGAIAESVPPKTVDMNVKAFDKGFGSGVSHTRGPSG